MTEPAPDQPVRNQALDVTQSFIVEAPAGSGKTELLIQRYLALMATANEPEEVLAITFTRKAAAEMRQRVVDALNKAQKPEPVESHKRPAWRLAGSVLTRSDERDWNILSQPARLRIMTIDSLNAFLVRTMPWLSGIGPDATLEEKPQYIYEEAAWQVVDMDNADERVGRALRTLLLHLDNNDRLVTSLLCDLLAKRDQWLRHLVPLNRPRDIQGIRQLLTGMFEHVLKEELDDLIMMIPVPLKQDMVDIARVSAQRLRERGETAAHIDCHNLYKPPGSDIADIPLWQALARLFLTDSGNWRTPRGINTRHGFESGSQHKERYASIHEQLVNIDNKELLIKFNSIKKFPKVIYTEKQWQLLEALIILLPICAGHLQRVFQRHSAIDFVGQALAARQAMGEGQEQVPDLTMRLDYSLKHILMDEFQDTSHSQFILLELLLEGWQPGDGRSLFLVGDPKQSIYRFREADVSGFLKARDHGIGDIHPQYLKLTTNFRSTPKLVDWFNSIFPSVLTDRDNLSLGGVSYSPAAPGPSKEDDDSGVHIHAQLDRKAEGRQITEVVRQRLNDKPDATIGVLARSRSHLSLIYDQFRKNHIPFQAVEILPLSELSVIQDLLSVTRSLLHYHDRIAWLAVLRAPWCGLTLDSLHQLCADEPNKDLWQLVNDIERQNRLIDGERQRLQRVIRAYSRIFDYAGHLTFRTRLEWLWKLQGAKQYHAGSERDTETYFSLLEQLEQDNKAITLKSIERKLRGLHSTTDSGSDGKVQLMTIHKSKGTEFDTVILPSLERTTPQDKKALLAWHEEISEDYEKRLLLAPIHARGGDDASFDFVRSREKKRKDYEVQRLLYVGITRAERHLHLFSTLTKDGDLQKPRAGSFLSLLYTHLQNEFALAGMADKAVEEGICQQVRLKRVPADWHPVVKAENIDWQGVVIEAQDTALMEFSWAGQSTRLMGIVVHQYLRQIGETGLDKWNSELIQNQRNTISANLRSFGLPEDYFEYAAGRIVDILDNVIRSERGRWLLAPHHEANNEYAISGVIAHNAVNRVIDRTFIDNEGIRWIIDYKAGSHEGGDLEGFLDEEQHRYRHQLEEYAEMLSAKHPEQKICLGLYFPLIDGWREWSYSH